MQAAKACFEYGFNKIGAKKIVAFTAKANKRSQRVMEKIGMKRNENGDFLHPKLQKNHELAPHILYRIKR